MTTKVLKHPTLSADEFAARSAMLVQQESTQPECWWWLSFVDPSKPKGARFLGIAIVRARGIVGALMIAHKHNCNPGGEVQGTQDIMNPDEGYPPIHESWVNVLLTRADADAITSAERLSTPR